MKRRILLLTAIVLSFSLLLSACGQKDIGEAKAKEIGLDYINNTFAAGETEALVTRDQVECFPDQMGAIATDGDAEFSSRWIYRVRVPLAGSMTKYEAHVLASTGEVIYANQHEVNIVMTEEQREQANALFTEEKKWGEKHEEALLELRNACYRWAEEALNASRPIVLEANRDRMPAGALSRTFKNAYYIVTRDGKVYCAAMEWPSMQVLSISLESER